MRYALIRFDLCFLNRQCFGSLPRSRFLGERCVTSKKRLRGRLMFWGISSVLSYRNLATNVWQTAEATDGKDW